MQNVFAPLFEQNDHFALIISTLAYYSRITNSALPLEKKTDYLTKQVECLEMQ